MPFLIVEALVPVKYSYMWQAVVVNLWDSIPVDILLRGESDGWRTVLKDIQQSIMYL